MNSLKTGPPPHVIQGPRLMETVPTSMAVWVAASTPASPKSKRNNVKETACKRFSWARSRSGTHLYYIPLTWPQLPWIAKKAGKLSLAVCQKKSKQTLVNSWQCAKESSPFSLSSSQNSTLGNFQSLSVPNTNHPWRWSMTSYLWNKTGTEAIWSTTLERQLFSSLFALKYQHCGELRPGVHYSCWGTTWSTERSHYKASSEMRCCKAKW